jgi:nitrate reductase (cytochrome), electron transfer subunit
MKMIMRLFFVIVVALILNVQLETRAQIPAQANEGVVHAMRGATPLDREATPPPMPKVINDDIRKGRAFAMQPPVIPHQIDSYQIDKNFNKCMTCHARERTAESQAPMVSVTHYMDRDNQFRAEISPRRYFCNQCHVPQLDVKPPVSNRFGEVAVAASSSPASAKTKKSVNK